jgi:hypothetical protein
MCSAHQGLWERYRPASSRFWHSGISEFLCVPRWLKIMKIKQTAFLRESS